MTVPFKRGRVLDRHPAFDRCERQKKKKKKRALTGSRLIKDTLLFPFGARSSSINNNPHHAHQHNKPHPPTAHQLATTSIAQRPAGSSAANSVSNQQGEVLGFLAASVKIQEEMEKAGHEHVIGIPVNNRAFGIEEPDFPSNGAAKNAAAAGGRAAKFGGRTGDRVAQGLKEHGTFFSNQITDEFLFLLSVHEFISRSVSEAERAVARWCLQ